MPAKIKKTRSPRLQNKSEADETSYESILQSIKGLTQSLHSLNQQAVREYTPVVESILRSRGRDIRHIEHTLDGLLSFCGYEPALVLYKKLCRHLWELDPVATAHHVYAYRDMWDSEESGKNECAPNAPDRDGA